MYVNHKVVLLFTNAFPFSEKIAFEYVIMY